MREPKFRVWDNKEKERLDFDFIGFSDRGFEVYRDREQIANSWDRDLELIYEHPELLEKDKCET
jgi:hypothetical protein